MISLEAMRGSLKGLSQIVPGARTASKNYYLSHIISLTVRAPGLICESPFRAGVCRPCVETELTATDKSATDQSQL